MTLINNINTGYNDCKEKTPRPVTAFKLLKTKACERVRTFVCVCVCACVVVCMFVCDRFFSFCFCCEIYDPYMLNAVHTKMTVFWVELLNRNSAHTTADYNITRCFAALTERLCERE